ncbi:MAG: adenosylcobinamide amidohydrolase [Myxococcales bacterium]
MQVTLSEDERFLEVDFGAPQRTLSWAIVGGGFGEHRRVVWHFVTRAELHEGIDAVALFKERMAARGFDAAVGLLTARYLRPYADARAQHGDVSGRAIVTSGLGNALRAGDPPESKSTSGSRAPGRASTVGTINVLCHLSVHLSDAAMLEALALASEARTLALLELNYPSALTHKPATGTGTDCIVITCPREGLVHDYAGKHTEVGAVVGECVHAAMRHATQVWLSEQAEREAEREPAGAPEKNEAVGV